MMRTARDVLSELIEYYTKARVSAIERSGPETAIVYGEVLERLHFEAEKESDISNTSQIIQELTVAHKYIAELERQLSENREDLNDARSGWEAAAEELREADNRLSAEREAKETNSFQVGVKKWMLACFGESISNDKADRNHRFLEEALELVQACGCTKSDAIQIVDYVFGRPVGDPAQEVGGVMVTLAALCLAQGIDMETAGDTELARVWAKIEQIRAKQAAKPRGSPLPGAQQPEVEQKEKHDAAVRYIARREWMEDWTRYIAWEDTTRCYQFEEKPGFKYEPMWLKDVFSFKTRCSLIKQWQGKFKESWRESIHSVADTDEHGLPIIPRPKNAPDGAIAMINKSYGPRYSSVIDSSMFAGDGWVRLEDINADL